MKIDYTNSRIFKRMEILEGVCDQMLTAVGLLVNNEIDPSQYYHNALVEWSKGRYKCSRATPLSESLDNVCSDCEKHSSSPCPCRVCNGKRYFVKAYLPHYGFLCNPVDNSMEGWFSTKHELESFSFVTEKCDNGWHIELDEVPIAFSGIMALYVVAVRDDYFVYRKNAVISGIDESDIRILKKWYPSFCQKKGSIECQWRG